MGVRGWGGAGGGGAENTTDGEDGRKDRHQRKSCSHGVALRLTETGVRCGRAALGPRVGGSVAGAGLRGGPGGGWRVGATGTVLLVVRLVRRALVRRGGARRWPCVAARPRVVGRPSGGVRVVDLQRVHGHRAGALSGPRRKYVSVSSGGGQPRALDRGGGLVGGDAVEETVEVGAGERPVERCRGGVVAILEGEDPFGEGVEIGQVVGGQHLALEDGEEDLVG